MGLFYMLAIPIFAAFPIKKVFGEGLAEYFYLEKCASNGQIHWAYCLWETGKGSALRG